MYKMSLPLTVAMLLCASFAARAEDPQANPIVVPDSAAAAAADCKEGAQDCKLVCKRQPPPLGTRIGGHTECRTRQWWEDRMREDQARIQKIQHDSFGYGMGVVP